MRLDSNSYEQVTVPNGTAFKEDWRLGIVFALAVILPLGINFVVLMATGTAGRFIVLLQLATPFLVFAWPISVPITIWIVCAYRTASHARQLNTYRLLWLVPLVVIPITMLTWGAVFAHPRGSGYERWQLAVVHWAFYASMAMGALAVTFNSGRRAFVAASALMLLLFSFSCAFTAGSSVTGDWL